jgi:Holliday junction resolvase-like predicted endonuclease
MSIIAELRDRTSHSGQTLIHTESESVLVSNVFGILKNLPQEIVLVAISRVVLKDEFKKDDLKEVKYDFWKKFPAPKGLKEGSTEVDVVIEFPDHVIFIEAKYLSDESKGTTHESDRDQLVRNLDIANIYAKKNNIRNFFVIYLTLDEVRPEIIKNINNGNISSVLSSETEINDIKDKIYWMSWGDISNILTKLVNNSNFSETELYFVRDLLDYLCKKGIAKNNLCSFNNKSIKADYYKLCRKDCNGFRSIYKWNSYRDESWRNEVWEEKELIKLLENLSYKQKNLIYYIASKGGGAYQRDIMNSLDFLKGKTSGTLQGIKAGINRDCKSLNKMPLLSVGVGSRDDRYHEINRGLGNLREPIINYIEKNLIF